MLETLDDTIRIASTSTFLYFELYIYVYCFDNNIAFSFKSQVHFRILVLLFCSPKPTHVWLGNV